MALFKELLVADLSGKVGANVFSHNRGGKYVRVLAIPTNPSTPQQSAVRTAFSQLTDRWSQILTPLQRINWETYAVNTPVTNRIGEQVVLPGIAMYVRCMTARLTAIGFNADDAPTIFGNSVYLGGGGLNATEAAQTIDFPFLTNPLTAPWANEAGSFMLTYVSRPVNPSVQYFTGPYRFAGSVQGDPVPPASPLTVNAPFPFVAGQLMHMRTVVTQLDGRISADFKSRVIAVA